MKKVCTSLCVVILIMGFFMVKMTKKINIYEKMFSKNAVKSNVEVIKTDYSDVLDKEYVDSLFSAKNMILNDDSALKAGKTFIELYFSPSDDVTLDYTVKYNEKYNAYVVTGKVKGDFVMGGVYSVVIDKVTGRPMTLWAGI